MFLSDYVGVRVCTKLCVGIAGSDIRGSLLAEKAHSDQVLVVLT